MGWRYSHRRRQASPSSSRNSSPSRSSSSHSIPSLSQKPDPPQKTSPNRKSMSLFRRLTSLGKKKHRNQSPSRLGSSSRLATATAPLIVQVEARFCGSSVPRELSRYNQEYFSSSGLVPTDRLCKGLLRRININTRELITRQDVKALLQQRSSSRFAPNKPLRYELLFRVIRQNNGILAEKSFCSYQKQELKRDDIRDIILDTHRIVGLFLRRHDSHFQWSEFPNYTPGALFTRPRSGSELSRPTVGDPLPLSCVPEARFLDATQSFERIPGFTIRLGFRSHSLSRMPNDWQHEFILPSLQSAPLNLALAEDLLWRTFDTVNTALEVRRCAFFRENPTQDLLDGVNSLNLDQDALDVELTIANNLGPDYDHLRRTVNSKLGLFRDPNGRDCQEFMRAAQNSLLRYRDFTDGLIGALPDFDLRILTLHGRGWSIDNPIRFIRGNSTTHSYSRHSVKAILDRVITGVTHILRGSDCTIRLVAHKRGHLVLDKLMITRSNISKVLRPATVSPDEQMRDIVEHLKERIEKDLDAICKDTCSIADIPKDPLPVVPAEPAPEPAREPTEEPTKELVQAQAQEPTKEPVQEPSPKPSQKPLPLALNKEQPPLPAGATSSHASIASLAGLVSAPTSPRVVELPLEETNEGRASRSSTTSSKRRAFPLMPDKFTLPGSSRTSSLAGRSTARYSSDSSSVADSATEADTETAHRCEDEDPEEPDTGKPVVGRPSSEVLPEVQHELQVLLNAESENKLYQAPMSEDEVAQNSDGQPTPRVAMSEVYDDRAESETAAVCPVSEVAAASEAAQIPKYVAVHVQENDVRDDEYMDEADEVADMEYMEEIEEIEEIEEEEEDDSVADNRYSTDITDSEHPDDHEVVVVEEGKSPIPESSDPARQLASALAGDLAYATAHEPRTDWINVWGPTHDNEPQSEDNADADNEEEPISVAEAIERLEAVKVSKTPTEEEVERPQVENETEAFPGISAAKEKGCDLELASQTGSVAVDSGLQPPISTIVEQTETEEIGIVETASQPDSDRCPTDTDSVATAVGPSVELSEEPAFSSSDAAAESVQEPVEEPIEKPETTETTEKTNGVGLVECPVSESRVSEDVSESPSNEPADKELVEVATEVEGKAETTKVDEVVEEVVEGEKEVAREGDEEEQSAVKVAEIAEVVKAVEVIRTVEAGEASKASKASKTSKTSKTSETVVATDVVSPGPVVVADVEPVEPAVKEAVDLVAEPVVDPAAKPAGDTTTDAIVVDPAAEAADIPAVEPAVAIVVATVEDAAAEQTTQKPTSPAQEDMSASYNSLVVDSDVSTRPSTPSLSSDADNSSPRHSLLKTPSIDRTMVHARTIIREGSESSVTDLTSEQEYGNTMNAADVPPPLHAGKNRRISGRPSLLAPAPMMGPLSPLSPRSVKCKTPEADTTVTDALAKDATRSIGVGHFVSADLDPFEEGFSRSKPDLVLDDEETPVSQESEKDEDDEEQKAMEEEEAVDMETEDEETEAGVTEAGVTEAGVSGVSEAAKAVKAKEPLRITPPPRPCLTKVDTSESSGWEDVETDGGSTKKRPADARSISRDSVSTLDTDSDDEDPDDEDLDDEEMKPTGPTAGYVGLHESKLFEVGLREALTGSHVFDHIMFQRHEHHDYHDDDEPSTPVATNMIMSTPTTPLAPMMSPLMAGKGLQRPPNKMFHRRTRSMSFKGPLALPKSPRRARALSTSKSPAKKGLGPGSSAVVETAASGDGSAKQERRPRVWL